MLVSQYGELYDVESHSQYRSRSGSRISDARRVSTGPVLPVQRYFLTSLHLINP